VFGVRRLFRSIFESRVLTAANAVRAQIFAGHVAMSLLRVRSVEQTKRSLDAGLASCDPDLRYGRQWALAHRRSIYVTLRGDPRASAKTSC
jgi:hypothetical protein